jgi:intein/homing endonuclease
MVNIIRPRDKLARKDSAFKLGEKVTVDPLHNCLSCIRWTICKDPKKSHIYRCSRYNENSIDNTSVDDHKTIHTLFGMGDDLDILDPIDPSDNPEIEQRLDEIIAKALGENSPIAPDIKIKDGEIPLAPNLYTWLCDEKFTGGGMPPFPRQIWVGSLLMADFCPRCSHMDYLESMKVDTPLSKIEAKAEFLVRGVCQRCGVDRAELIAEGEMANPHELVLICGQRSSKTSAVNLFDSYNTHRYLKLPNPSKIFKQLPQQVFTTTYTSSTFGQVRQNMWEPFLNIANNSPWFSNYHKFLTRRGHELGEELFNVADIYIRYRHRNLFLSPASPSGMTMRGRCLVGSTMVNTNKGFVTLNELIQEDDYVPVKKLTIDSPLGERKVSHTYKTVSETCKIKTRNGYGVEGTPEHPMLILTKNLQYKWCRLDQLKIGDFIVSKTAKNTPMFGTNDKITPDLATITGNLIANGYKSSFSSNDEPVVKRFRKAVKRVTGFYPTKNGGETVDKNGNKKVANYSIKINKKRFQGNGTFITEYLQPLGFNYTSSYDKEIPLSVRQAPKEILHEFLESYFECDCGINGFWDDPSQVSRPASIDVSSASKKLINQLHTILLHMYGIVGRKKVFRPKHRITGEVESHREHWQINITGYDAWLFLQTFKRAKVHNYANRIWHVQKGDHSDRRLIPWVRGYLISLYQTAKNGSRSHITLHDGTQVGNSIRPTCIDRYSKKRNISPHVGQGLFYDDDWSTILPRIRDICTKSAKRVSKLLALEAHYEEVVSITRKNKRVVYDVTVPEGHAFTANALVSHNTRMSAAIDEISHMPLQRADGKKAAQANAKDTYNALRNSLDTLISAYKDRFNEGYFDLPKPIMYNASSPLTINDYGMTLYRQSKVDEDSLGFKYKTWEFNPHLPESYFANRFRANPVDAARDYACEPPIGQSTWLTDVDSLANAFTGKRNMYEVQQSTKRSRSGKRVTVASLRKVLDINAEWGCVLAIDVGAVNNSFAFSVSTVPNDFDLEAFLEEDSEAEEAQVGIVPLKVLFVGEVIPKKDAEISQTALYSQVFSQLCEDLPINLIVSDRWQNKKMSQDLEEEFGIDYYEYKLRWEDFENMKEALYENAIEMPKLSTSIEELYSTTLEDYPSMFKGKPIEHLAYQFMTVQEARGNTVVKGDATDDMFRCIALSHAVMQDKDMLELLLDGDEEEVVQQPFIGLTVSSSTGVRSSANQVLTPRNHAAPKAILYRGRR